MASESTEELGHVEYWNKRYREKETHEWFRTFEKLQPFLLNHLPGPETNPKILHLGCGDSSLTADLASLQYTNQLSVDFSDVVIQQMQWKHPDLEYCVADIRNLELCGDASIDVAIDKGTMDSMVYGSQWDPPDEVRDNIRQYIDEVARVLKPAGQWLYITFRQPHFVKPQLHREGIWDLEVERLEDGPGTFEYFGYMMTRRCTPSPYEEDKTSIQLITAARFGQFNRIKFLLRNQGFEININAQDDSGASALFLAVANSHSDIVAVLLANPNIDVNLPTKSGSTPLDIAVTLADSTILFHLLVDERTEIDRLDRHGRSVLSWAAEYGYGSREIIWLILRRHCIEINQWDSKGRTPISYAAQHGHHLIVKTLITLGQADPLLQDRSGRNAHSWAAQLGKPEVLLYLTQEYPAGADIPDHDGWTPAAYTLDAPVRLENLEVLLRHGNIDVNRPGGITGQSLLALAARYNVDREKQLGMAVALLRLKGLNLEARDVSGRTPLSQAAGAGSLEVAQALLSTRKVDVNTQDQKDQTPLMWATKGGFEDVVRFLLQCPDINVDARDTEGLTAVDIASKLGHTEIVPLLETRPVSG